MHSRNSLSLGRELRESKGMSWGVIAGLAISAIAAHRHANAEDQAVKDKKRLEEKRLKKETKLAEQDRITMSPAAQVSQGSISTAGAAPNSLSLSTMGFALAGIVLILVFAMRK
jgi:hypothetical protein